MVDSTELDAKALGIARRYARWEIGSSGWADLILWAYFNPDAAEKYLDGEDSDQW